MRSGTAVFTMPSGPIKCAGAPQKIAYLAADYWRQQGVLNDIRVVLVLPTPGMFGVKVFSDELERVVARYGIEVRKSSELVEVDPDGRQAVISDNANDTKDTVHYDLMHVVPPQSAPDWIKAIAAGGAGQPGRLRRHRQAHDAARALPEHLRAGRRRLVAQLQDRRRDPQAGAGGGRQRARPR